MLKSIFFIWLSLFCVFSLSAQKLNWKKLKQDAEAAYQKGDFALAAENFEKAWQLRNKEKELIFMAGESYYSLNDYRKAAEAYQNVKDENDDFSLVGLKYARSLKQDAQYDKAKQAFTKFLDAYSGQGKPVLEEIIRTEIQGCEMAAKMPLTMDKNIELASSGKNVNSNDNEFAPFSLDGALYFSSDRGGKARVYMSDWHSGKWTKANTPRNFPVINNENYANATLTPDGSKMYFTICNSDKSWDELKARCELFVTQKTSNGGWSSPERLPEHINQRGVTATQPMVYHNGDDEVLLFVSNRDGGRGGNDIWMAKKSINGAMGDFSFPINLGPSINTIGDEISPFYDEKERTLYFSSNGLPSIGGFDVFKSSGSETTWTSPQNLGMPVNSSANDYSYTLDYKSGKGFFVSNRIFGGDKITTRNTDILEFSFSEGTGGGNISLNGSIYDKMSGDKIIFFNIALFELTDDGQERLLYERDFSSGDYSVELLANRRFKAVVNSDGYEEFSFEFSTDDPTQKIYGQPVFLDKKDASDIFAGEPSIRERNGENDFYTTRGISPEDASEYTTNAPRFDGTYYKIQLAALKNYDPQNALFRKVENLGSRLDTETLVNKSLTRVLLADFFSRDQAFAVLRDVIALGFDSAFVVKYEDGIRHGKERK